MDAKLYNNSVHKVICQPDDAGPCSQPEQAAGAVKKKSSGPPNEAKQTGSKSRGKKKKGAKLSQEPQLIGTVDLGYVSPRKDDRQSSKVSKNFGKELDITENDWPVLDSAVQVPARPPSRRKSVPSPGNAIDGSRCKSDRGKSPVTPKTQGMKSPRVAASARPQKTPKRNARSPQRNFKFESYIPLFQIQQGLKRGEFIEGALRINPRNFEDAYVSDPDNPMDIYIGGIQDRNRALNGDTVVVQVKPKQEWRVLCDAIKDYEERHGTSVVEAVYSPISTPCKVHTPEKFSRAQSRASTAWSEQRGPRGPDSLEILGIDELTEQLSKISTKPKKNRSKRHRLKSRSTPSSEENMLEPGSERSSTSATTTTYSRGGSSEDYLSKLSSENSPDNIAENILAESGVEQGGARKLEDGETKKLINGHVVIDGGLSGLSSMQIDTQVNDKKTALDEPVSVQHPRGKSTSIVISPEQLLDVSDGNVLEQEIMNFYQQDNSVNDSDQSSSNCSGIVVPPDALTGDEFTESASACSSPSKDIEQAVEDADFLSCQQDAQNNNVENVVYGVELENSNSFDTGYISAISSTFRSKTVTEVSCKMEVKSEIDVRSIESVSESVCSAAEVLVESRKLEENHNFHSTEERIVQFHEPALTSTKPILSLAANKEEPVDSVDCSKKSKRRKKKRKSVPKAHNVQNGSIVNENIPSSCRLEIQSLTVEDVMRHPMWPEFIQKTGRVVYIRERKHSCIAAGHIKIMQDRNPNWALFSPKDNRLPRIMVPMSDCPNSFYHRPDDYSKFLFLAEITDWREDSKFADGRLIKSLGSDGDVEPETEGILFENGVDFSEFPNEVIACLPKEGWKVTDNDVKHRKDFRNTCIFTIDPATARDMDDAVSCEFLPNGNFLVGVHIADVTHFVREDTPLDECARGRATSVYLVQKVVPMLPRMLCDSLCSLTPGEDRLTVSVLWEMTPSGNIVREFFERSVIRSCIKMSYEHAQEMIEKPKKEWSPSEHPQIYGDFSISDINIRVLHLHHLAVQLRNRRFEEGALRLDQTKLQFTLNHDTGLPLGFTVYEQKDSNRLIEEFMLLANMAVAHKIYKTFPQYALLRCHPPPEMRPLNEVVKLCARVGIHLDASSSGSLQASITRYSGPDELSLARSLVLTHMCAKPMNPAQYFCSGTCEEKKKYHHYALNVPLYTHFTSPIRRYPDIIVHRLLAASLDLSPLPRMDPKKLQKCAEHCNDKKYNAKRVSEMSDELFFSLFVKQCSKIEGKAMVIGVMDHSFDCLVLHYGVVKRVYCDKLPLLRKKFTKVEGIPTLTLFWKSDEGGAEVIQSIKMFSLVEVTLSATNALQVSAFLKKPASAVDASALF